MKLKHEEIYQSSRPVFLFDVAAIESWLEDWAKRGYRLVGFRGMKGEFVWDSPASCRYRLQPMPQKEPRPELEVIEAYEAMGWTYVTSLGKTFHLWRCDDPAAPELDTDPVVQAVGYGYLKRRMTLELALELLALVLITAGIVWNYVGYSYTPLLDLITRTPPFFMTLRFLYPVIALVLVVVEWRTMGRLLRRLEQGIPLNRPVSYRWKCWGTPVVGALVAVFLLTGPSSIFTDRYMGRDLEDPAAAVQVALHDIDPALPEIPGFIWAEGRFQELAPRQSRAVQESGAQSAMTDYYGLLWEGLAPVLEEELLRHYAWETTFEPMETAELDSCWWMRSSNGEQCVVARKGREVLHVDYTGPIDLRERMDVLSAALSPNAH